MVCVRVCMAGKVGDPAAGNFIDLADGQVDTESVSRLNHVKDEFIPSTGLTNIKEYTLDAWSPEKGLDPALPVSPALCACVCVSLCVCVYVGDSGIGFPTNWI